MISPLILTSSHTTPACLVLIVEVLERAIWALESDRLDQVHRAGHIDPDGDALTDDERALLLDVRAKVSGLSDEIEQLQAERETVQGYLRASLTIEAMTEAGTVAAR